jgi:plastocyanin
MKVDLTKLPIGGMVIGFIFVALIVTFAAAFIDLEGNGDGDLVSASPTSDASPSPGVTPQGEDVFEVLMIPVIAFDVDEIVLPANTEVTMVADNQDTAILHNWAAYTDTSASELIAKTALCAAPCVDEVTFTTPPPGEYFFRCDVHPIQMVGTLIVQ